MISARFTADGGRSSHRYRAHIYLYLGGGADSFSFVAPVDGCADGYDLHADYVHTKGAVAYTKEQLLHFAVPEGTQPCTTFGFQPQFTNVRRLYNALSMMARSECPYHLGEFCL